MNTRLIVWSFALLSLFSACAEEGSPSDDSIGVNGENLSYGRGKGDKDKKPKPPQAGAPCAGSGGSAGKAGAGGKGGAGGAGGIDGAAGAGGAAGAAGGGGTGNCDYTKNLFSQIAILSYLGANSSSFWDANLFNFVDADTTKYLVPCQQREKDYAAQERVFDMGFCLIDAVAHGDSARLGYVDNCIAKTSVQGQPDIRYGGAPIGANGSSDAADYCELQQLCNLQNLELCAKAIGLLECKGLRETTPSEQDAMWTCMKTGKVNGQLVNLNYSMLELFVGTSVCPSGFTKGGVCMQPKN